MSNENENYTNQQDLGISKVHGPDSSWARSRPVVLTPSEARLKLSSSFVTVRNTSPDQRHVVIDRNLQGHELQPGEVKQNVEMTNNDIDYFHGRRKFGHPVIIEGKPRFEEETKSAPVGQRK